MRLNQISFGLFLYIYVLVKSSTAQEYVCGKREWNLTEEKTAFRVPAKDQFTQNTTCKYIVRGDLGTAIALQINALLLGKNGHCDLDYIKVAENDSLLENSTDYTCGNTVYNLWVGSNKMVIELHTSTIPARSFVNATLIQGLSLDNPEVCGNSTLAFNGEPEMLEVPLPDKAFTEPTLCHYAILSSKRDYIDFEVASMKLSSDANCTHDYLELSDSPDDTTRRVRYCDGKLPSRPFLSLPGSMFVVFRAQTNPETAKLRAVYYTEQPSQKTDVCGPQVVRLKDKSQYFFVPYAVNFTVETKCNYVVIGRPEHRIQLQIRSISLGNRSECDTDYIKVAENSKTLMNTSQITCSNETRTFGVSSNVMFIEIQVKSVFQRNFITAVLRPVNPSTTTEATTGSRPTTDSRVETDQTATPRMMDRSSEKSDTQTQKDRKATGRSGSSAVMPQNLVWILITFVARIH